MSASRSTDALAGQPGIEFGSRVPASEPLEQGGHKPGVKAAPADHAPAFSTETLPAGTAPRDRTFAPNLPGQALNEDAAVATDPLGAFPGATSADVHVGLGKPIAGEEGKKHEGVGKVGRGVSGAVSGLGGVDERASEGQRGLERELDGRGERGGADKGEPAKEREPVQVR